MPTGYFNSSGDPRIDIEVSNPLKWKSKLACIIDTGFTGFLSIPIVQAFPIGLLLVGTIPITLADGKTQYRLICLGQAHLVNQNKVGIIIIEPSSKQALLGMDFLKRFNKRLVVDPTTPLVELIPAVPPVAALAPAAIAPTPTHGKNN